MPIYFLLKQLVTLYRDLFHLLIIVINNVFLDYLVLISDKIKHTKFDDEYIFLHLVYAFLHVSTSNKYINLPSLPANSEMWVPVGTRQPAKYIPFRRSSRLLEKKKRRKYIIIIIASN